MFSEIMEMHSASTPHPTPIFVTKHSKRHLPVHGSQWINCRNDLMGAWRSTQLDRTAGTLTWGLGVGGRAFPGLVALIGMITVPFIIAFSTVCGIMIFIIIADSLLQTRNTKVRCQRDNVLYCYTSSSSPSSLSPSLPQSISNCIGGMSSIHSYMYLF